MTIHILLVDDLQLDVQLTRRAIGDCDVAHEIAVAHDGQEALDMVDEAHFDLLLLDIKMPRMDGFEFLEELRHRTPEPLPAIVLSGSALVADRARADALGAIEYVHKSLDFGDFKRELKSAMHRHGFC